MTESSSPLQSDLPEIDPAVRRSSRIKLLAIIAIFAVPLILASLYLQMVRMSGGALGDTSRGQLVEPAVPLTEFSLQGLNEPFTLDTVRGLWTLMYVPAGECLDACKLNLYHMRQVRLALNHRMDRVQRAVVVQSDNPLADDLVAEHPGLLVATEQTTDASSLSSQIEAAIKDMAPIQDAIYLIDPFGNLMLRFPHNLPPKSMLKDIKHLLKVSRIG